MPPSWGSWQSWCGGRPRDVAVLAANRTKRRGAEDDADDADDAQGFGAASELRAAVRHWLERKQTRVRVQLNMDVKKGAAGFNPSFPTPTWLKACGPVWPPQRPRQVNDSHAQQGAARKTQCCQCGPVTPESRIKASRRRCRKNDEDEERGSMERTPDRSQRQKGKLLQELRSEHVRQQPEALQDCQDPAGQIFRLVSLADPVSPLRVVCWKN